jgi:hypothetical protein
MPAVFLTNECERRCTEHTRRFHHPFQVVPNGLSACLVHVRDIKQQEHIVSILWTTVDATIRDGRFDPARVMRVVGGPP